MMMPSGALAVAAALALLVACRLWLSRADRPGEGAAPFLAVTITALATFGLAWMLDPLFADWSWGRAAATAALVAALVFCAALAVVALETPRRRSRRGRRPDAPEIWPEPPRGQDRAA